MIYNFNLGIGWASSGVEYAQAYRANVFRRIGQDAKFVFMDMFPRENIQHMTANIGFLDSEVIWLYKQLSDAAKSKVSNYSALEAAEIRLRELESEPTEGDAPVEG